MMSLFFYYAAGEAYSFVSLVETTVSIVTIHVSVKIFILQDPNIASER